MTYMITERYPFQKRKILVYRNRAQLNIPLLLLHFLKWTGSEEVNIDPFEDSSGFIVLRVEGGGNAVPELACKLFVNPEACENIVWFAELKKNPDFLALLSEPVQNAAAWCEGVVKLAGAT